LLSINLNNIGLYFPVNRGGVLDRSLVFGLGDSGNYSMGIREQVIFPEIDYNQIDRIRGFQVTISTTAKTDGEAARLLELLGMPFARQE